MTTLKDQEINRAVRKTEKDLMNSRMGVYPNITALKGECPGMTTHKGQEMDRIVRKSTKDPMNSRMGVCPSIR